MTQISIPLAAGAPLVEAGFVARLNQFTLQADLDGQTVRAYMADRGRLRGLLQPGVRLVLARHNAPGRKMDFQAVAVYVGDELVSLDTHLPNRLIATALQARLLPQFFHYPQIQAEVAMGSQRFDFRLQEDALSCLIEVKSVTQIIDGLATFPDAPTERGRAQLEVFTRLAMRGQRTAVLFVVQRSMGRAVVPNETIDPQFASALRRAIMVGVEAYAYRCPLSLDGIELGTELPVYGTSRAVPAQLWLDEQSHV